MSHLTKCACRFTQSPHCGTLSHRASSNSVLTSALPSRDWFATCDTEVYDSVNPLDEHSWYKFATLVGRGPTLNTTSPHHQVSNLSSTALLCTRPHTPHTQAHLTRQQNPAEDTRTRLPNRASSIRFPAPGIHGLGKGTPLDSG